MAHDLAAARRKSIALKICREQQRYPTVWSRLTGEWRADGKDAVWLTYSANYLINTAGVRWAIDPFSLTTRVGGGQPDFARDLAGLELVFLTHAHSDHLDFNLLSAIRELPAVWLIPEFLQERVIQETGLSREWILTPRAGEPVVFGGVKLTLFDSLHLHPEGGLPEMGCLAEFGQKRWLFPGDIRTYDRSRLPDFGPLDGVFAHLWLGKAGALLDPPPRLEEFCCFYAGLQPQEVVITHLEDLGREPEDYWTLAHYRQAARRLKEISPGVKVRSARTGQRRRL